MYSKRRQPRKQTKSRSGRRKTQRGGQKTWQERLAEGRAQLVQNFNDGKSKALDVGSRGRDFLQEKIEDLKGNVDEFRGRRDNLTADAPLPPEDTTLQQPDKTIQTDDKVTLATLQDQVNNLVKFVSSLFDELRAPIFRKEFNNDDYRKASFNRLLELKTKTLNPEP